jgi:hypothetical protein
MEMSGAPIGRHLHVGKVGGSFSGGGAEADSNARDSKQSDNGSNNLFHNCICFDCCLLTNAVI